MNKNLSAIVFAIAIVIFGIILSVTFLARNNALKTISVTGLGSKNFTSDLIVWRGNFKRQDINLKAAYSGLEKDREIIRNYLKEKGLSEQDFIFSSVNMIERQEAEYSDGKYIGTRFAGYELNQDLEIESTDVEKIEKLSRSITEVINLGIAFYSQPPQYYYTKLSELKIEMIARATEDARVRAEQIAANAGAGLGGLKQARMGVFQITGQNSDEEYSWGGVYNTMEKHKTARITMRLEFEVD